MKKLSLITTIFFLIDILIFNFNNIDFSYNTLNFIPNFAFIIYLINSDTIKLSDQILIVLVLGLFQDIFAFNFTLVNMLFNLLLLFLYKFWSRNISGTIVESTILLVIIIFIKDILIYLFFDFIDLTNLTLTNFILNNSLITFSINIIFIPIILLISKNYLYK